MSKKVPYLQQEGAADTVRLSIARADFPRRATPRPLPMLDH